MSGAHDAIRAQLASADAETKVGSYALAEPRDLLASLLVEYAAADAAGYARAVADVVAYLRRVGAGYEVETPIEPRVPFGDPMYRGVTVRYCDPATDIEQGAHVGAAVKP